MIEITAGPIFRYKIRRWRVVRGAPVPAAVADQITVLGLPNARFWAWIDTPGAALVQEATQSFEREKAATQSDGRLPPANFLVVSGGGGDGAFGAGLICGWFDTGAMPTFKLVTGVSTGSMIAPFAFLGGPYIDRLRRAATISIGWRGHCGRHSNRCGYR